MKKSSNTEAGLKKSVGYKKSAYSNRSVNEIVMVRYQ